MCSPALWRNMSMSGLEEAHDSLHSPRIMSSANYQDILVKKPSCFPFWLGSRWTFKDKDPKRASKSTKEHQLNLLISDLEMMKQYYTKRVHMQARLIWKHATGIILMNFNKNLAS